MLEWFVTNYNLVIYLKEINLAYVAVPKNACTTLKSFLYKLQNKREFHKFQAGHKTFNIHNVMPTPTHERWSSMNHTHGIDKTNTFIFAIARDPLTRFLSCYKNRVLMHDDIGLNIQARKKCNSKELPVKPDINTFVENLSFYQEICDSINHHTMPQVEFLGNNPNYYSKIYQISNINSELWSDLSEFLGGENLPLISKMHRSSNLDSTETMLNELSSENTERIQSTYAADYKFLEGILI